jgi:hypothetical protein
MELIFTAFIAALGKLGEQTIMDGYQALKDLLGRKFSQQQDLQDSIAKLEAKPDSPGRRETLREELAAARVDEDDDIVQSAAALLEKLKALPGGPQVINQTVTGNQNIFSAAGDVNVTIGRKRD